MRRLLALAAFLFVLGSRAFAADITVCASGCDYVNADLQDAIDAAACGDTIKLGDGELFRPDLGGYKLTTKNPCTSYTTLTRMGTLPDIYDVIEGCYQLGPSFLAEMAKKATCKAELITRYETDAPKIYVTHADQDATFGQPITIGFDADYWKIQGVHIYTEGTSLGGGFDGGNASYGLILIGFDEVTGANPTDADEIPHHIIIDRVSMHGTSAGSLARCIYANGNYVEFTNSICREVHARGADAQALISISGNGPFHIENNFTEVAGEDYLFGGGDPTVPLALPSDIVQTRNYMTSDWTWWANCDRLLAAYGYSCTYGGIPWQMKNKTECKNCQRNDIYGNIIEGSWGFDQNGNLMLFQSIPNGPDCDHCTVSDVSAYNNVVRYGGQGFVAAGFGGGGESVQLMGSNISATNNLFYGIRKLFSTDGTSAGECAHFVSGSDQSVGADTYDDITFDHNTCDNDGGAMILMGGSGDLYSNLTITNNIGKATAWFSAISMTCACNGGTDGFDIMAPASYTVSNNAIMTHGLEFTWPADNWFGTYDDASATLALYDAIFVDLDTMDYTVAVGSAYKAGGARDSTTGTDLGVDMSLLPEGPAASASKYRFRFR